jgi:hypothetical protein
MSFTDSVVLILILKIVWLGTGFILTEEYRSIQPEKTTKVEQMKTKVKEIEILTISH